MKNVRSFLAGMLTTLLIGSLVVPVLASSGVVTKDLYYNNITITLDGKHIDPRDAQGTPVEPFIIDGTTYLPVRAISEALGLYVSWDSGTNTVTLNTPASSTTPKYEGEVEALLQKGKAFDVIVNWVKANGKTIEEGVYGYLEVLDDGSTCSVIFTESSERLSFLSDYRTGGARFFTVFAIDPWTKYATVMFDFRKNENDTVPTMTDTSVVDCQDFNSDMVYKFSNPSIEIQNIDTLENYTKYCCLSLIDFMQDLFDKTGTDYTVATLGFLTYKG